MCRRRVFEYQRIKRNPSLPEKWGYFIEIKLHLSSLIVTGTHMISVATN